MKGFLSLIICALLSLPAVAQVTYAKAYIVNDKGDTIRGEAKLNPKKEHEAYDKVFFKDPTGAQKSYKPGKTKAYGFDDKHFVSMDSEGEPKFYMVLSRGAINFYKLGYEALKMNDIVHEIEYYISHAGNEKLVLVKEGKFKKQMTEWMKDEPEFISAYDDDKKFDEERATAVITQYNNRKAGK